MTIDDPVYLYVIGRTDMKSLTAVKAGVQLGHACNQMVFAFDKDATDPTDNSDLWEWQNETGQGFGTVLHLDGGPITEVERVVALAKEYDLHAGIVVDPTFPIRDGGVTHYLNIPTCGFVFGRKSACEPVVGHLQLMPSPEEARQISFSVSQLKQILKAII